VSRRVSLGGTQLHDLRYACASFGASGGRGLRVAKQLAKDRQPATTTARYTHLDNDPLRRGLEAFGGPQMSHARVWPRRWRSCWRAEWELSEWSPYQKKAWRCAS
jgi:hypothetical protein